MYRCEKCKKVVSAKRPQLRISEYRLHQHPFRAKVQNLGGGKFRDDKGGVGNQIVREIAVCFKCNDEYVSSIEKCANTVA